MGPRFIWKYPLRTPVEVLDLPTGSKIVHVNIDPATSLPCVWIEHGNDHTDRELVTLRGYGTGHQIDDNHEYLGTAIDPDGLVWHIYQEVPPS